jgi:hypothetical protein
MSLKPLLTFMLAMPLVGCVGSSSGANGDAQIVGTWGVTASVTSGASTQTDETYLVVDADNTVREFSRSVAQFRNNTQTLTKCGTGTYAFANGVLSTTITKKSWQQRPGEPKQVVTETVSTSAKVEFIDTRMRLTNTVDVASPVVYSRGTLPDGIAASCPQ